jgi:hypothetical protein
MKTAAKMCDKDQGTHMQIKSATFIASVAVGLICLPVVSHAATCTSDTCYSLSVVSSGFNAGTGPFGFVGVSSSGGTLSFDVEVDPNFIVHTGNATKPSVAFALSNTTGTFDNIVPDASASTAGFTGFKGGPFSNGSFGGFNYGLNCEIQGGQGGGCGSSLKFEIDNAGALVPGTNNVTNDTIWFVVDIFSKATGATGSVAAVLQPVPLPPAVLLFGTALMGVGILGRRRKKHLPQAL